MIQWIDIAMAGLVFYAVVQLPGMLVPEAENASRASLVGLGLTAALIWPLSLHQLGLYGSQRRTQISEVLKRFTLAGVVATALIAAATVVVDASLSAEFAIVCGALQFTALATTRIAILTGKLWSIISGFCTRSQIGFQCRI